MSPKRLQEPLEHLHSELEQATSTDSQQPQLQGLQQSTRQLLDTLDQDDTPLEAFRDELTGTLVQFEATHPRITLAVMNVIDALNRIGI
jgi:ABC-type transporter Mla subunit MlaD